MGFHDISSFKALLAKQAWCILQRPNSLVARVFQSKYWRNGSFMDCGEGTRPSYAWRSILHGRELLVKGLVKRIGNGNATKVWTENWLQNPIPREPMYKQDIVVDLTLNVADLLIPQTCLWDTLKLNELFIEEDVASILSIKPLIHKEHRLCWGFTREGSYSSQSGYKLIDTLKNMQVPGNGSLPPIEKSLWKNIWKLQTTPKIRHFIWRAMAGALAVAEQLHYRGIPVDRTCKACGACQESICHTLFNCPTARDTWSAAGLPLPERGLSQNSVFLNMHHLVACTKSKNCSTQLRQSIPWVLWQIWKARNVLVFEKSEWTRLLY
ncbi:uncharacterized protein LOC103867351 [Brassica rapa]|uniref:uncharacterized protein LOC103867351 n=1 Tax=Brassica campestris TaxID=3711 RepID=UPI00142DBB8C|nr:uncharacterized protein LOC103867351 [Brassica rapa]XP_033146953.1 uncharacterized protein LOC103867351 [Brassica rapa]